jgi:adenylate cyclase class 2
MLEIEQRFNRVDFAAVQRTLAAWGAGPAEEDVQADHYFNAPDRDFRQTGESFRVRRVGPANFATYKGPRRDPNVRIRTELEIPLVGGDDAAEQFIQLLKHLGYRFVVVVRKRRLSYPLERDGFGVTVCLDEVDLVGRFVEVEVLAPEEKADAARAVLTATAGALGLTELEQRSYLGMVLEALGKPAAEAAKPGTPGAPPERPTKKEAKP